MQTRSATCVRPKMIRYEYPPAGRIGRHAGLLLLLLLLMLVVERSGARTPRVAEKKLGTESKKNTHTHTRTHTRSRVVRVAANRVIYCFSFHKFIIVIVIFLPISPPTTTRFLRSRIARKKARTQTRSLAFRNNNTNGIHHFITRMCVCISHVCLNNARK